MPRIIILLTNRLGLLRSAGPIWQQILYIIMAVKINRIQNPGRYADDTADNNNNNNMDLTPVADVHR